MVNKELLKELKEIVKEDYGIELDREAVIDMGQRLLRLAELLIKINKQ